VLLPVAVAPPFEANQLLTELAAEDEQLRVRLHAALVIVGGVVPETSMQPTVVALFPQASVAVKVTHTELLQVGTAPL